MYNILVRDVIPVSGDERIRVVLRSPEGLENAGEGVYVQVQDDVVVSWMKNVDGTEVGGKEEGRIEWNCALDLGEEVELKMEWDVIVPVNLSYQTTSA